MPNENLQSLEKVASLFTSKFISPEEMDTITKSLVSVLAKNKKSYEEATKGHQENNQALFNQVVEAHGQFRNEILQELNNHKSRLSNENKQLILDSLSKMESLVKRVENIKLPKDGENGKDADEVAILKNVLKRIPKAKQLTAEDIVNLLLKKRLPLKAIDGLDKFMETWSNAIRNDVTYKSVGRVIGGGDFKAGSGITISSNGIISSTATGSGYTVETPSGTVNGSNTSFTVTATPVYIVSDGATYFENNGYTLSGLTVTMSVPPLGYIRSFHS